ncbi:polar amino acid transport system substrate-binding protein [Oscillospiraceae bacterium]|nr:polar amino acid transport system substrate-binding protein [Oscillospiraceae bacterium]
MKNKLLKMVAVAMVACVGFSIASCGKKEKGLTINEGKLIMATNAAFAPYEYYDGDTIVGIDAEIAAEVASRLNLELEIQDVAFDSIIAGVQSGKYDIGCAGMTITDERLQSVNFTTPYATGIQSIIVKEGSEITDIDTLIDGDYIVGVQQGTTGDLYMSDDIGDDRIDRYNNGADAILALNNGNVDAVVIDNQPALALVEANEGLIILETPYTEEEYAMAVNKDNTELLNEINRVLAEMESDGTIDAIIEKYIPSEG